MLFTDEEHSLLAEICDAFVGPVKSLDGDDAYWQNKASNLDLKQKIETTANALPAQDIIDLKKVLKLFSKKTLGIFWRGPMKPFNELTLAQKEKLLFRWSRSSIGNFRKAFNVFRKMAAFMSYSASADEIPHIHSKIGYKSSSSKIAQYPTKIKTLFSESNQVISCEVLIVGSGAGGGLAAGMLADAGKDVVLLEKGSYINEEGFTDNEWDMVTQLYDRGGALATNDGGVTVFAGSCLGGGTTVNWNGSFATPDRILEEWTEEHQLDHLFLKEYEQSRQAVFNLFNVNKANSVHNPQNQKLWDGASKRGLNPELIARNVVDCQKNGFENCGFCGFGCKGGCKQGTMRTTIQTASDNGARIYCNTEVKHLTTSINQVTGAVGFQNRNGELRKLTIKAEKVIVACGSIHTPALLMRSGLRHPELGKNLYFHPTVGVAARYSDLIEPWSGPMMSTVVSDAMQLDGNYGYWIETAPVHPGVIGMTLPWTSIEQHKKDLTMASNCGAFIVLTRDKYGGKVRIDNQGNAVINYKMHSYDLNHAIQGMKEASEIHFAAGATEVIFPHSSRKTLLNTADQNQRADFYKQMTSWKWRANDYILYSAHQMSTCRMGGNNKTHPVRPDGSFVGYNNLFIADGSALPSCPGINPMMSIMAQSHFTIKNILNEY